MRDLDILRVEERAWLAVLEQGVASYDFAFDRWFSCRRPYDLPSEPENLFLRAGAVLDYGATYRLLADHGLRLINSPEEHERASELCEWYPRIQADTPASRWYETPPTTSVIESEFDYPVFIKGSRQTAAHSEALCVARNTEDCRGILDAYRSHAILGWQTLVCREYVPLRRVSAPRTNKVPASFEFRTFWYRGQLVGAGPYWSDRAHYTWSPEQETQALIVGARVCDQVDVPFLAIDLALTEQGKWIVIECNDAQESGYAGVSPLVMWRRILELNVGTN